MSKSYSMNAAWRPTTLRSVDGFSATGQNWSRGCAMNDHDGAVLDAAGDQEAFRYAINHQDGNDFQFPPALLLHAGAIRFLWGRWTWPFQDLEEIPMVRLGATGAAVFQCPSNVFADRTTPCALGFFIRQAILHSRRFSMEGKPTYRPQGDLNLAWPLTLSG